VNNAIELRHVVQEGNGSVDELQFWRTFARTCPKGASVRLAIMGRGERTRTTILRAFVDLLFRDGFERISVRSIVAKASIARSTFYEHFSNKEDVLRASMAQFFVVLAHCASNDEQPIELTNVLAHFWENRRLTDAIFSGIPRQIIALSLSEAVEARLRDSPAEGLLLPYRLASIHIAEAQLALIEAWLRGRAFAHVGDLAAALHQSSRASALAIYARAEAR
jgi:AcrR family transcriptional regulator